MDWLCWHHGTVTDPKWRVVARKAGVPLHIVIAIWPAVLEAASQAEDRGRVDSLDPEDVAAALDLETEQVQAVLVAMQGKVLDGDEVTGWRKRNPKRADDLSTERVRRFRERSKQEKRDETQGNAKERPEESIREDKREEKKTGSARGASQQEVNRRLRRCPDGFEPDESHQQIAQERRLDLAFELAKFRDHEFDKPKSDWPGTFRNWLRSARANGKHSLVPVDTQEYNPKPFNGLNG